MTKFAWLLLFLTPAAASQTASTLQPDDLLAQAKQTYTQDGPAAALPQFEQVLSMYRAENSKRNEAITLGLIANCYRGLGQLNHALELANQALTMKEQLGDRGEIGKTNNQLGLIYWYLADYPSAIKHFEEAVEIGRSLDDAQLEGSAANNMGLVLDEQGDYRESLQKYHRALELHRSAHFERGEGDTLGNIGGVYLLLGRFREALEYYRQALAISQRLGLKPAETDDLGNIAICLKGIGEIDDSLTNFDQALQIAQEAGLPKEEADWRRGKASVFVGLGRYDAALAEYGKAREVYERSGLKRELIDTLNDTGQVYELLGDTGSADKEFHRALELAQSIGNSTGVIASKMALGDLERRRKQYDSAEAYFRQALESARTAGDEGSIVESLIQSASNNLDRKRLDAALESASEARQVSLKNGDKPAMAVADYIEGESRRVRGELQQALDLYTSAEKLQRILRDPELGWRILYGRGQAMEALRKDEDALSAYKASVVLIEQTRSSIDEERFRAGYMEDRFQVYVALVELLLKLGKPSDAFFFSEKLRARAYLDQLGGREIAGDDPAQQRRTRELREQIESLRGEIEKEYSAAEKQRREQAVELFSQELEQAQQAYQELLDTGMNASPPEKRFSDIPESAEIQRLLPPDTALLEYVVGKETLSILTMKKDSITSNTVKVTAESLASRTELLRDLILERKLNWVEPGRGLQALLITPLENAGYLHSVKRLIVVPDGVLNYVPFAALPTDGSRVLGDDFVISYLPAAAALAKDKGVERSGRTLLAMAPADSHLPNAAPEIRSIGQLFPQSSMVVAGKGATKTLFKRVKREWKPPADAKTV